MQRMFAPFGASAATFRAPANVAPAVMPTKMPSLRASSPLHLMPFGARDVNDPVDHLHVDGVCGQLRDEVWRPALHGMRLEGRVGRGRRSVGIALLLLAAAEQLRVLGLAEHDLGVGHFLGEHARDALQRSAGAVAGHPVVELLALEVVDDLARRGAGMDVGLASFSNWRVRNQPCALASSTALTTMPKARALPPASARPWRRESASACAARR